MSKATRAAAVLAALAGAVLALTLPGASGAAGGVPLPLAYSQELLGSWGQVGNSLYLDPGVWTQNPTSYSFQWYRCDANGDHCAEIPGATGINWTIGAADLGHTLFAATFATNASGTGVAATYLTGVVGAPTVVSPPTITGDANVDGTTLSVSTGTWTGSPTSYDYQWFRCDSSTFACTAIDGATASTYQVHVSTENGNYLVVQVRASDASGSADNIAQPSFAVGTAHTDVVYSSTPPMVPAALIDPSWTGDPSNTGNVLVGDLGVWLYHPTTLSPQWYDCDAAQNNCIQIIGATGTTYTVQASDAGHTIEFAVDPSNLFGTGARYGGFGSLVDNTYVSAPGAAWAPEPIVPPELRDDATGVGSLISVSGVTWSAPHDNNIDVTYQWIRCNADETNCLPIAGATSFNYVLTADDLGHTLFAVVDGTNDYGTTSVQTTTITPPIGAPVNSDPPLVTGDTSATGLTLSATTGTWSNSPTGYAYQWFACEPGDIGCAPIGGATGASFQPTGSQFGKVIYVEVDATNTYGTASAFSASTDPIGAPYNTASPPLTSTDSISGGIPVALLGDTLSVGPGTWNGSPTSYAYQWYRCDPSAPTKGDFNDCQPIGGATSSGYTTVSADLGHTIYAEVDATNGVGTVAAYAWPLGSVGAPQPLLDDGSIQGTAQVGQTLTFVNGSSWEGDTPITFTYQWSRCDSGGANCVAIGGATSDTYSVAGADQGHVLQGVVRGANVWGANGWGLAYQTGVVAGSSGGGGGGGGGGGSVPNLKVVWSGVATTTPKAGSEDDFVITVSNTGGAGALQTHLVITLPPTLKLLGPPSYDRGSGCTGTQTIDCFLDYVPNGASSLVKFAVQVSGSGTQTLTATASSDREADAADNTATATITVASTPPASTPPTTTPKPKPKGKTIRGTRRADRLHGTPGPDTIFGGAGNDAITGGGGADHIHGGPGNDTIYARDGVRDVIDCGPGRDVVYADKRDAVSRNCEVVRRK
jgi:hypothetical protein